MMELKKIISMIGGKILYGTEEILRREYSYAVASDLMSNVMLDTADDSILITSLVNPQVIRGLGDDEHNMHHHHLRKDGDGCYDRTGCQPEHSAGEDR